nr:putative ORF1 [Marmot picobirnavirus]
MTTTQVRYWELQESKRHNKAGELLGTKTLTETKRHNLAGEKLTATDVRERIRHNKASESLSASQISESIRHNKVSEYNDRLRANAAVSQANTSARLADSTISLNQTKSLGELSKMLKGTKVGDYASLAFAVNEILSNPNIDSSTKAQVNSLMNQAPSGVTSGVTNNSAETTRAAADWMSKVKKQFEKWGISASNWSWTINQ